MLCACMLLCGVCAFAQNEVRVNEPDPNKPHLFDALPDKFIVNPERIAAFLVSPVGSDISIGLGDAMTFQGKVVSAANNTESNNISSIVIRSTNYQGARLTFSKIIIDGVVTYSARILSMQHGDLFELQSINGQHIFIKKKFYDLINE